MKLQSMRCSGKRKPYAFVRRLQRICDKLAVPSTKLMLKRSIVYMGRVAQLKEGT